MAVLLRPAAKRDILALMNWFPTAQACRQWGGPQFRFPFTKASFIADTRWPELASYALTDREALVGFGQFYSRVGCCHFGRLAIAPSRRGDGLGKRLLGLLAHVSRQHLPGHDFSLFVLHDNDVAHRLYRRVGFVETSYPGHLPLPNCRYMVAPAAALLGIEAS